MEHATDSQAYAPRTPWRPVAAVLATVLTVVLAVALSLAPLLLTPNPISLGAIPVWILVTSIALSQAVMGLGGWWLAGTRGGTRHDVLSLKPMQISTGQATLAVLAMFAVTLSYQAIRHYGLGHDIFADMRAMAPLFQGSIWPLSFLLVSFGAPIAEEVLFRGFFLSAFGRSIAGFVLGVALGTLIWTVLHAQYGLPGLILVALMGLMFSAMLRWSGSLRLPIIAHAANNTVASLYLLFFLR
jgi:membrane protease YdiL (CAAX protease family)